jgi:hypothetical protein
MAGLDLLQASEHHERRGIERPTTEHTMVDHIDCDSLNCLRANLRWATPRMNRHNRYGQGMLWI